MVDKPSSRQELWLYIKNEKFILNFHPHKIFRINNHIVVMAVNRQIL